jgi:agmatinase
VVIIPVPWEVTVSYGEGTAQAPEAVFEASKQVDLFDQDFPEAWQWGVAMLPIDARWADKSDELRVLAAEHIDALAEGDAKGHPIAVQLINKAGEELKLWIKETALHHLKAGKQVGLLGGDHSTPLGLMEALAEHYGNYSILQLDAHADLRDAYEGFIYSHASIMYNALKLKQVERLVQAGIRDMCQAEMNVVNQHEGRIKLYDGRRLSRDRFAGLSWQQQCDDMVSQLGEQVYISFDIDALEPHLCPNTGTPVPGGFSYEEAMYLIEMVLSQGKRIIGFDLCEVGCSLDTEYDAVVGARVLQRLANLLAASSKV